VYEGPFRERVIAFLLFLCAFASVFTTLGVIVVLLSESLSFFQQVSLSEFLGTTRWTPLFSSKRFGVWPLVSGTLLTAGIALLIALPAGLLIAIYLSEYAVSSVRNTIKPLLEILAGVPTVVYGYFALFFVTPMLQYFYPDLAGMNALSPGIVMGIMIIPMVASLSEDALYAIPRSLREGAFAMGATRLQMISSVLVPSALGGITAAFMLAVSRAVGETMIVAIAAGQRATFHFNPMEQVQTMTGYIVQVSLGDTPRGSIEYSTIFAVGSLLFLMTLLLNVVSLLIRDRYRRMYQ
jgi:phosphate transport system permease protein